MWPDTKFCPSGWLSDAFVYSVEPCALWLRSLLVTIGWFFFHVATVPSGLGSPHYRDFKITFRDTTFDRICLVEWSAQPLPDKTQHSQTSTSIPAGFEPTEPPSQRLQTQALDRAPTGIGRTGRLLLKVKERGVPWWWTNN